MINIKSNSARGFTMLEVLVSMVLFGIVSIGMTKAYIAQMHVNTMSETRSQAVQAAIRVLDFTRTLDPATLPNSGSSSAQTIVINNKSFAVKLFYCRVPALCSVSSRNITAQVSFKNKKVYEVSTVFAQLR